MARVYCGINSVEYAIAYFVYSAVVYSALSASILRCNGVRASRSFPSVASVYPL